MLITFSSCCISQINCLGASQSSMFSHGSLPFLSLVTGQSRNTHSRRGARFTVRADTVCSHSLSFDIE